MKRYYLLMLLVCLFGGSALAQNYQKVGEINFNGLSCPDYGLNNNVVWEDLTLISAQGRSLTLQVDETRRVSLRVDQKSPWNLGQSSELNNTAYFQNGAAGDNGSTQSWKSVYIDNLKQGDKIILTTNPTKQCAIWSNNTNLTSNNKYYFSASNSNSESNVVEFIVTEDGPVQIQCIEQYSGIHKIELYVDPDYVVVEPKDPVFNYDPGFEVYDMFEVKTNNGVTYGTSDAGFTLNGGPAQYVNLSNNANLTFNERIAVNPESGWTFNRGLQAPNYNINNSNWYNFSICNLKEGDRVEIFYTGTAPTFSTQGQNGAYNGCSAFKDTSNDGDFNSDEGDQYIYQGMSVEKIDALDRREGTISQDEGHDVYIYTSAVYVITQDGHLDLGIQNGSDTRIVKIKIYSDHQATMVDEYDQPNKTYWAHFDVTGELKAKEHIVPGGLEVHVGNNNEDQHAIVVSSKFGPMSYVNAARRFKIPGIEASDIEGTDKGTYTINFNLTSQLPETGTFYKFIAQEAGKMTVKFQGNSMYYYRYDLAGDAIYYNTDQGSGRPYDWEARFDRANEQTYGQASTYYLMEENGNNAPIQRAQVSVDNGDSGVITYQLEKGHVYYLYGVWRDGASNENILITNPDQIDKEGLVPYYCGVAEVYDIEFCPDRKIHPLAKWVPNGTTADEYLADVTGYSDNDLRVKLMTGNIRSCTPYIQNGKLKIKDITFATDDNNVYKNRGGVILIKVGDPSDRYDPVYAFTVAYSADPQYDKENADGSRGHTWDFSSNSLNGLTWNTPYNANGAEPEDLGTYFEDYFNGDLDENSANGGSLLWKEMNYQVGGIDRSDWMFNYRIERADGNNSDPRFLSKYDMEGDNADMLYDTEGIIIEASSNQSCIFNEFKGTNIHASANDPDRYIGILPGGAFRIPWLKANDRVIIYMGSGVGTGNEQMVFNITNALDATYKEIVATDDYVAGGSQWNGANSDNNYRGCYHFFAKEDGDMIFNLTSGSMCKLYKIQIYRGDRINTNEVVGETSDDKFLLWSRAADPNDENDEAAMGPTYNWTLKYFGKAQKLADGTNGVNNDFAAKTGCINYELATSAETDPTKATYNTFSYPNDYGQIGTFRARGKDMEKNMKYVADFGEHNVTIAYQQTMEYPYTWDFMDMTGWGNNVQNFVYEDGIGSLMTSRPAWYDSDDLWNASYEKSSSDLSLWEVNSQDNTYYLRLNSQSGQTSGNLKEVDNIFETAKDIDGNQVWANGAIVPETQGLWFYTLNNNSNNGTWGVTNDGLAFNGLSTTIQKVVVPNVPAGAAVYLRMVTDRDAYDHAFEFKGGNSGYKVYGPELVTGTTDEYILAVRNDGAKRHLTFSLAGYQLKKLSVSTDPKSVNIKGYASESRDHAIDASLLPYFTDKPIKSYLVSSPDYTKHTITLTDVSESPAPVIPTESGYVIYNPDNANDTGEFNLFGDNKGFHLFVPDMHDKTGMFADVETNDEFMIPVLKERTGNQKLMSFSSDGKKTNYVLSYKWYYLTSDGSKTGEEHVGDEMFYRVSREGINLRANSAYLVLDTEALGLNTSQGSTQGQGSTSSAKFTFVFSDWNDTPSVPTAIEEANSVETFDPSNGEWYNMNGQKLNGIPATKGLYIVNGKKVLVK